MEELLLSLAILAGNEPVPLVKALFRAEIEFIGGYGEGPLGYEAVDRLYTEELGAEIEAVLALDAGANVPRFDPNATILPAEYCELRDLEIAAGEAAEATALVTARFRGVRCSAAAATSEAAEIVFELVNVGGEWRIADFDHSRYGSFHALLEGLLAP